MKKLAIASIMAVFVLALAACSQDGEVVVESEAGNITKSEFYEELKSKAGQSVLNNMVITQILEEKYDVKDQVDAQIKKEKEQYGDSFSMYLQQQNFKNEEDYREYVKQMKLQEQALIDGIEVSDEAVQKRYNRMQYEVEVSHILVKEKKKAQELIDKLNNGADFAKLAEENSQDPGSAKKGGSYGFIKITDQYVAPFKDAAFDLEPGEISEPVQTTHGWHVIKVTDKRDVKEEIDPLKDMKEDIKNTLAKEKLQSDQKQLQKAQENLRQMITDAKIDVKIDEYKGMFNLNKESGNNGDSQNSESGDNKENSSDNEESKNNE
ncbi:foldase [Virgibacillus sp. MSP4-1]|uniref:peptidylprolyl isomerase n=1 Tax=Virgibacillus sp. MSP4-1 TaxID=2700081 RepID=UPI0003A0305A|nr:peptidylprolyl isomerase [Virgibacillus sp. MSP4-1]QHS21602.1 foldase [Virgibacillus sp. MSP4-1]